MALFAITVYQPALACISTVLTHAEPSLALKLKSRDTVQQATGLCDPVGWRLQPLRGPPLRGAAAAQPTHGLRADYPLRA